MVEPSLLRPPASDIVEQGGRPYDLDIGALGARDPFSQAKDTKDVVKAVCGIGSPVVDAGGLDRDHVGSTRVISSGLTAINW